MFNHEATGKCRVIKAITTRETFYCLQPATVVLYLHTPEGFAVCSECARRLAKELIDSVPGGRKDMARGAR